MAGANAIDVSAIAANFEPNVDRMPRLLMNLLTLCYV